MIKHINLVTQFRAVIQLLLIMLLAASGCAVSGETVTYYHNDALGSPVAASDDSGNIVWREEYRPFGARIIKEDGGTNTRWYTGKQHEEDFGLSYFGSRWYEPATGRFMGVDPVDVVPNNIHSFNRYAYANNNPYKFTDPNGEYADLAIEAISISLGIASFTSNIKQGNYGAAAIDAAGVVADSILAVVPGAPGAIGLGIKAGREGLEQGVKQAVKSEKDVLVLGRGTPKDLAGAADAVGGRVIDTSLRGKDLYKHIYGEMRKSDKIIQITDGIPSTSVQGQQGQWSLMEKKLIDNVDRLRQKTTRVKQSDLGLD